MKKFLKKIGLILATVAVAFGFGFMPMTAYAEEVMETPEIGTENTENSGDTATDGETPETNENGENTDVKTEETDEKITLEDLLGLVGSIAEQEGLGDEWAEAVENIKLAISENKLDVNIILDALLLVVLTGYAIYKVIGGIVKHIAAKKSNATVLTEIQTVEKTSNAQTKAVNEQTKAINALAETDGQMVAEVKSESEKIKALAGAITGVNTALRCFIRGTAIKTELKDEAYRALNASDEQCDKIQS